MKQDSSIVLMFAFRVLGVHDMELKCGTVFSCAGGGGNTCVWSQKWSTVYDKRSKSLLHSLASILLTNHVSDSIWDLPHIPNDLFAGAHHTCAWASGIFHTVS